MCRNIKQLFNFKPKATSEEIKASSIQFVKKVSGFSKISQQNELAFDIAVKEVELAVEKLLDSLVTTSIPKNREEEALKAKMRNAKRFG